MSCFQIHFELNYSESFKVLLAEFLILRSYCCIQNTSTESDREKTEFIQKKLLTLKKNQKHLERIPEGASGKKRNREFKKWKENKRITVERIEYYNSLLKQGIKKNLSLFNCIGKMQIELHKIFNTKPYGVDIENANEEFSYCLINSKLSLEDIECKLGDNVVEDIETVFLFDCLRGYHKRNITYKDLEEWNSNGTNFKNFILLTFGGETRNIHRTEKVLKRSIEKFNINQKYQYVILSQEVSQEKSNISSEHEEHLMGHGEVLSWNYFQREVQRLDCYELCSIKIKNYYSLCFTKEIKKYIIDGIFEEFQSSFLTSETKRTLKNLNNEDIECIKSLLNEVLDYVININIETKIQSLISKKTVFLVDSFIRKDKKIMGFLRNNENLIDSNEILSWEELEDSKSQDMIFLSYRDFGNSFYEFHPNLYENRIRFKNLTANVVLPKFLFRNQLKRRELDLIKNYWKIMDHSIRKKYFYWDDLKNRLNAINYNEDFITIDYDFESQYIQNENRTTYIVKTVDSSKSKIFHESQKVVVSVNDTTFRVLKVSDIYEDWIDGQKDVSYQPIEDLFTIIDKMDIVQNNPQKLESKLKLELDIIRERYRLDKSDNRRLWKELLKGKVNDVLDNQIAQSFEDENNNPLILKNPKEWILYQRIEKLLSEKKLEVVSFSTFLNSWINPKNTTSITRDKRVMKEICDYLELPKNYFLLLRAITNAEIRKTTKFTIMLNRFFTQIFDLDCFSINSDKAIKENLGLFESNFLFEDIEDTSDLFSALKNCVELIRSKLNLQRVESIVEKK
ncbi:MAG: hypothetical protein OXE77_05520 [Flavobacteriaceae bacterium]|nr:hypothetical protein [Flavobacteriaceae bacterium]MCY4267576.1 hypothetical protein [Flavobacteriaceae bacterium]